MKKEFDERILDNEIEFKKRFKRIERPAIFWANPKPPKSQKCELRSCSIRILSNIQEQSEGTTTGYQTLINQTLRDKISGSQADRKADEVIERLLQDKAALGKLKAEPETM